MQNIRTMTQIFPTLSHLVEPWTYVKTASVIGIENSVIFICFGTEKEKI